MHMHTAAAALAVVATDRLRLGDQLDYLDWGICMYVCGMNIAHTKHSLSVTHNIMLCLVHQLEG